MAIQDITATSVLVTGTTDTLASANVDGYTIANPSERMWIEVNNGSGGSINVTIETVVTEDGLDLPDRVVAVGAGVRKKIGPFKRTTHNTSGKVKVTFSAVTTVTFGAFTL